MNDRWKREIFLFEILLDVSLYDFQFPRYRRVKKRIIFSCSFSHLIDLPKTPNKWQIPKVVRKKEKI